MSRTVLATLTLAAVAASTLSAPVAGYKLTLTEKAGAVLTGSGAVDATSISIPSVPPGTYTGFVVAVDAAGNALGSAVPAADPLVVVDAPVTVMVNVPASLVLALG